VNIVMLRSTFKKEHVADAQAAIGKVFVALEETQPTDVRYASTILGDGVTLVAFLELEPGGDNPLAGLPAYVELLEKLKEWQSGPPAIEQMTVLGSYHLF
jgi:hypothetical protein